MIAPSSSRPTPTRTRADRAWLRAQGLRPITHWMPDIASPVFHVEAHRQSLASAAAPHADDDQAFIDAISEHTEQ